MKQLVNKSISKKLFGITFGLILFVILSSLTFQLLFFEKFYLSQKTKDMIKEVNKFKAIYSFKIDDESALTSALYRFEQENESRIAIFSVDGKFKYLPDYYKGVDDLRTLTAFATELLNNKELIYDVLSTGETKSTIFENQSSNSKKIGIMAPMSMSSNNDSLIISVSSTQPIKESSNIIKEFYKYLLTGFIIIGVFLSFIYTNLVTKPLVKINKVAKRMSSMDFTAKCEITSDDEIGNLGETLNFLSSNLEDALENLKQKNKALEEDIEKERKLEEMRKDFVAGVSHDLKTPIGIIEGYAEGIKDGIATGNDATMYLETIIDEAHKMNKLVSNMLELSKLESGNLNINIESFNIIRLIQKTLKGLSLEFQNKYINLYFNPTIPYAYVNGDTFQLEQVITNLLTNALKYTPNGNDVIVDIIEKNNLYTISIENKGVHIPESELENIYTKFYRLDKSRNRNGNSSGLGLAIVKRILTIHNSLYKIENTKDGVKFSFSLEKNDHII